MERTTTDEIRNALTLALKYLDHPDVQAMPFALSSSVAARRLRAAVTEIEALIEHKRRAELVIEVANNEIYKLRNPEEFRPCATCNDERRDHVDRTGPDGGCRMCPCDEYRRPIMSSHPIDWACKCTTLAP